MTESATQIESIALYRYLCQNIVGSEEHVKAIRMMNTIKDQSLSNRRAFITSGSFGEGLVMRGSDFDFMIAPTFIEICEKTYTHFDADKIYFTMESDDTQPGYTRLRLLYSSYQDIILDCDEIGSDFYYSNFSFKNRFSKKNENVLHVHGPCVTDKNEVFDVAYCLQSKLWITTATQWITRSNNSWPRCDIKQAIVKHGVLFVPIGVKGSWKEELEWRISFSVGEKLLIYTFTHTQLLCYALMKILLKDIIALDVNCKELLCSYFMKTILFWISEELPSSMWRPTNLIACYMRCFRRLIYYVEYRVCPHYFIPENNLFENKIPRPAQNQLLNKLYSLNSYGWQSILLSKQITNFHAMKFNISKASSYLNANFFNRLLIAESFATDNLRFARTFCFEKVIYKVLSSRISKIKYLYTYYMSKYICNNKILLPFDDMSGNKSVYKQYNTWISTLLLNTRHDAVSGWLMLASFFYKRKQYNTALYIVQYSLLKCTAEKLHLMTFSDIHYELINLPIFRKMTVVHKLRILLLDLVMFPKDVLPDDLQRNMKLPIPPVVYAHFLCFLCHYHLNNSRQCWNSFRCIELTIQEHYFIATSILKAVSYNIIGISYQLLGDKDSARQAFMKSIKINPIKNFNLAFQMIAE